MIGLLVALTIAAPPKSAEPRYQLRVGARQGFSIRTGLEVTQELAGKLSRSVLPDTELIGVAEVTAVAAGRSTISLTVERVRVHAKEKAEKGAVSALRRAWKKLAGMRIVVVVTDRGVQEKAEIVLPAGVQQPPELREAMQGLFDTIRALHVPLPRRPLAKGDRFEVGDATTFSVKRSRGRLLVLEYETAEKSLERSPVGGLPADMRAETTELLGVTKGEVTLRLNRPLPGKLEINRLLSMKVQAYSGKKRFELSTSAWSTVLLEERKVR